MLAFSPRASVSPEWDRVELRHHACNVHLCATLAATECRHLSSCACQMVLPGRGPVKLQARWRRTTTDVKQQVKVGARAGATAPVSGAHVMAGLGSVPVGRWQGPGRDCWSRRCGRSGEAREARSGINLWSRECTNY